MKSSKLYVAISSCRTSIQTSRTAPMPSCRESYCGGNSSQTFLSGVILSGQEQQLYGLIDSPQATKYAFNAAAIMHVPDHILGFDKNQHLLFLPLQGGAPPPEGLSWKSQLARGVLEPKADGYCRISPSGYYPASEIFLQQLHAVLQFPRAACNKHPCYSRRQEA